MAIVGLSLLGIILEEIEVSVSFFSKLIMISILIFVKGVVFPVNPTIIRVMRVLRIARVLKLLKMAKGIRSLLDTVMQALPQVIQTFHFQ